MARKLYVLQATNRHFIKRLSADVLPATYDGSSFGVWGVPGSGVDSLNFPRAVTSSATNIFIADTGNKRIVKLDLNLTYVGEYDVSSTIGEPYAITYDNLTGDIYIVGVYNYLNVRIERITTALISVKVSGNLNTPKTLWWRPNQIQRSWTTDTFIITGQNLDTYLTVESTNFSALVTQPIIGEVTTWPDVFATTRYFGFYYDSSVHFMFLNNGRRLLRSDETFTNTGDSDEISKDIRFASPLWTSTLGIYNVDVQSIINYDYNLNYVGEIFVDSGETIETDAYDVTDIMYKNI